MHILWELINAIFWYLWMHILYGAHVYIIMVPLDAYAIWMHICMILVPVDAYAIWGLRIHSGTFGCICYLDSCMRFLVPVCMHYFDSFTHYSSSHGCICYINSYSHFSGTILYGSIYARFWSYGCIYYVNGCMSYLNSYLHYPGTYECKWYMGTYLHYKCHFAEPFWDLGIHKHMTFSRDSGTSSNTFRNLSGTLPEPLEPIQLLFGTFRNLAGTSGPIHMLSRTSPEPCWNLWNHFQKLSGTFPEPFKS